MNSDVSRRVFLASAASASRVLGANDRVRLGVIGSGGRGTHLMRMVKAAGGGEIGALCDAWDVRLREGQAQLGKDFPGVEVKQYSDYRRLLEQKDLDAVIVASTDHWHSRMAVDAMHAGIK